MQLVYDRFETIESNFHKAYYHVEDVDPELWNKLNEDKDPGFFVSGYNITVSFNEEADNARNEAYSFLEANNLLCIAGLEYDFTNVDPNETSFSSTLFRFINNLAPSLFAYIEFGIKKLDYSLWKSLGAELEEEKATALNKALADKLLGFERYLDYKGIHLDQTGIKRGKEILVNGSDIDFYQWISQFESNSIEDTQFQIISNPLWGSPGNVAQEVPIIIIHLLEYCIKKHETEYKEWKTGNAGLKGRKTAFISNIDFVIGRFSLQRLFYLYYNYVEGHILDMMFYAMNAETSDGDLNKQLVEAVRNYPDPQFAIEVNERYKEYKRYNPGCIDLPFVDQDAEPKLMASTNPFESNMPHIDVRLGKYFEVSLNSEDVSALYNCFYQMFDSETKRGDIIYYLSTGADDGLVHNGIKWQGSRVGLALFLKSVLPPKKDSFWDNVYNVFRIKRNDEWAKTGSLKNIYAREWDTKYNRKECEKLESLYNNWMIKRPNLKGKWEFKDWRKKS